MFSLIEAAAWHNTLQPSFTRPKSDFKRLVIEGLIDFINFAIIFFIKAKLFKSKEAVNW